jgi:hypothetical protein
MDDKLYIEISRDDFQSGILHRDKTLFEWKDLRTIQSESLHFVCSEGKPTGWWNLQHAIRWQTPRREELIGSKGDTVFSAVRVNLDHSRKGSLYAYVMKDDDDWFWVCEIKEDRVTSYQTDNRYRYFRCDQREGLAKCLRDRRI